jgi:hypothetical protein
MRPLVRFSTSRAKVSMASPACEFCPTEIAFRITTCATAVDMTPVAKHMAKTNLLNFIRRLLKVWIKEIRTKNLFVLHYEVDVKLRYSGFRGDVLPIAVRFNGF